MNKKAIVVCAATAVAITATAVVVNKIMRKG